MALIEVQTRGKPEKLTIEDENVITIMDLKKKLSKEDPTSILLTFNGKILTDSTPINTLGEAVIFIMEKEIEFAQIHQNQKLYKSKIDNKTVYLREDQIFFKDGRPFLITKKIRKLTYSDILAFVYKKITRERLLQLFFILFGIVSKNHPLFTIILTVNTLKFFSYFLLKYKAWQVFKSKAAYKSFMFFASMFAIDHEKFIQKTETF
ncbi:hypothetical protein GINT2_000614 [Glugoides intestinalis]